MFINFMCEPDIGKANVGVYRLHHPHAGCVWDILDEDLKYSEIAYPSEEIAAKEKVFTALSDEVNSELDVKWSEMKSYDEGGSGYLFLMLLAGDAGSGLLQYLAQGAQENAQYVLILRGLCGGVQPLFVEEREKNDE